MPMHILDEMNKFLHTHTVKAGSDLKQKNKRIIEVFAGSEDPEPNAFSSKM